MKVGLIQYSLVWEDKKANESIISGLVAASPNDISLFICPEMTLTGFSMHPEHLAEEPDGPTYIFFSNLAREKKATFIYGCIIQEHGSYYNTLFVIDKSGNAQAVYKKIHLFSFASENLHYKGGSLPVITQIDDLRFGLSICYDLRFPELYRNYARHKVDCIIDIANWPAARIAHWDSLLPARAIENLAYFIAVNRTGNDPAVSYPGHSAVFSPLGERLSYSEEQNTIVLCDIEREVISNVRERFAFLDDITISSLNQEVHE
ncbi:MAG: nitrilase family protein [Ignavibacteria bacterium]|nr:nitrilase family protein [Ignavibacteria bacterium]